MTTTHNTQIVALIERAEREIPFCDCGAPMAAMARHGEIWLGCTADREPSGGTLRRLIASLAAFGHTRKLLISTV